MGFVYQRKGVILLFRLRRIEESVNALERAVALESRDRVAHVYLGLALIEAKRWSEAAERMELALSLDPESRDAMIGLVIANTELQRFDRAEAALRDIERLAPGSPQIPRLRDRLEQKRVEVR